MNINYFAVKFGFIRVAKKLSKLLYKNMALEIDIFVCVSTYLAQLVAV